MKRAFILLIILTLSHVSFASVGSIAGDSLLCTGSIYRLSDTSVGGTWSSSNTLIASINDTGLVTAISAGVATITYSAHGAMALKSMTINATPSPISGPTGLCIGQDYYYVDTTPVGMWSISTGFTIYMVSYTTIGLDTAYLGVSTISYGASTILYTSPGGCSVSFHVTVVWPGIISGATTVSIGSSIALYDTVAPGTWSSSDTSVATVDSLTGVVTGVSAGTATIIYMYTNSSGCGSSEIVTVARSLRMPMLSEPGDIAIYPNPTTAFINIAASHPIHEITICNTIGQTVYNSKYDAGQIEIDVSALPPGLYFVKEDGYGVQKLVKE